MLKKLLETSGDDIDLYYVLAMTPSSGERDRYVFDGEAPFGVAVNQIPPKGDATHFQHGISANLANLTFGETFDFAYSLRDSRLDSITTLTMVHDMQTNIVFMSISPSEDSVSHSYQPEAFDPKLFEFPEYFFEGFPNSLDMDFTEKLIRFSFDGVKDSLYQGIYLSSTTPSIPSPLSTSLAFPFFESSKTSLGIAQLLLLGYTFIKKVEPYEVNILT